MNEFLFTMFLSDYYSKTNSGEPWKKAGSKILPQYIAEAVVAVAYIICFFILLFATGTGKVFLQWIFGALLLFILIICAVLLGLNIKSNRKKQKKPSISTLASLLIQKNWNNEAMLTWLIQKCQEKSTVEPVKKRVLKELTKFFATTILPVVTLCCTIIAESLDIQSLLVAAFAVILFAFIGYVVILAFEVPFFHKQRIQKEFISKLGRDLEYMLARLKATGKLPFTLTCTGAGKETKFYCRANESQIIVYRRKMNKASAEIAP